MKISILRLLLRGISLALLLAAFLLGALELQSYRERQPVYPAGSWVAGVPVGGLDPRAARERVEQVYSAPVELRYDGSRILLRPDQAGFSLNMDTMLAEAGDDPEEIPFWVGFWDYLQERRSAPVQVPLEASNSSDKIQAYLEKEIQPRYDRPASPPLPYPGTVNYRPGKEGRSLDVASAIPLIEKALLSKSKRSVDLPLQAVPPPGPSFRNLQVLLKQTLQLSGFSGLAGLYLEDLQTGETIDLAYQQGEFIPAEPGVPFAGASTIKIPIMVSVYRRLNSKPDEETERLLGLMIEESGNEAADWLMERVIDPDLAPLLVTDDMQRLGLQNTFLAGFFHEGAPLLELYNTPANTRPGLIADPDVYNQTTPKEIGSLLGDIYTCSETGGGHLVETFPGEITQEECQAMLKHLAGNKTPYLVEAGVPEEVNVVHKHGWVSLFGVIHTIGDDALVRLPGGAYVLSVYLYSPDTLLWEPASRDIATLSRAVYNYYVMKHEAGK